MVYCGPVCEHACAQESQASSSVHLPFDELQPADLSLRLTVAPLEREGGSHRSKISL